MLSSVLRAKREMDFVRIRSIFFFFTVLNHLVKSVTLFCMDAGDTVVGINPGQFPF